MIIAHAVSWPNMNNPHIFAGEDLNTHFADLPQRAELVEDFTAWPASHWASHLGGISYRWSGNEADNFNYKLYSKEELLGLEAHLIDALSPAEKYDILMNRFDYPTVYKERRSHSPNDTSWFGICHGVAPASLNHAEPVSVSMTTDTGIDLHFYSSDVKALMSYYYAKIGKSRVRFLGERCYANGPDYVRRRQRRKCADVDPAAFHIIYTNFIGLKNKSFIADIDPWVEVWNHVPKSYYYDVYEEYETREGMIPGAVKTLWIGAALSYAGAIAPYFNPVIGEPQGYYVENNYQYMLDLDENGNIIGGEWISELRPDFLWLQDPLEYTGYFEKIKDIYSPRVE